MPGGWKLPILPPDEGEGSIRVRATNGGRGGGICSYTGRALMGSVESVNALPERILVRTLSTTVP